MAIPRGRLLARARAGHPGGHHLDTIWLTNRVQSDFDQELRRKANLANEVFGVSVANVLAANDAARAQTIVQQTIDQTRAQAPEIDILSVTVPSGSGFQVLASSQAGQASQPDTSLQTQLAWSKTQAVASLVTAGESTNRDWQVTTPVIAPNGRAVAVTTMRVSLRVSDQLFQRFYRARNADTQDIPGTGLGLWIIKQYAQAMGGNITVASKPHEGTTFTVTLPLVK